MTEDEILREADALARNIGSLWNGGANVLERMVQAAAQPEISPYEAIRRLGSEGLAAVFATPEAQAELHGAFQQLARYLATDTWFDGIAQRDARLRNLKDHPVAYFCAEFGLARWLPLYSGGLGVLAGDVLKEASDAGLPLIGVGLFYRHGYFNQKLDQSGYQCESYPTLEPAQLPITPAVDASGRHIVISVPIGNRSIEVMVWQLNVGRTILFLLDTDIPSNSRPEDRQITSSLYAGDQDLRVRQEIVLGIGGARALQALGLEPAIYSMNEGHAAFLSLELLAGLITTCGFSEALERTRARIVYTNHTVVPAGNDVFSADLVRTHLGDYVEQSQIGLDRFLELGSGGSSDTFSMAMLAFHTSGKANAVSELHGAVIPREWPGFPVEVVTNGVHAPTWLGPEMRALLDHHVPDWRSDAPSWDLISAIPDGELWRAHVAQRRRMVELANRSNSGTKLDSEALTLVWARRFAEYKRAGLLAADLARLRHLLSRNERPVQLVMAGKAHPRDEMGKRVLQSLFEQLCAAADDTCRFAFVTDYTLEIAQYLVAGADVWVNTPRKPLEASGTSGMKSSDNGGLQLTVRDGWANEVDWYGVGWGIDGRDDAADAAQMYEFLENDIIPSFFTRDESGVPVHWVAMMKKTVMVTLERFSARRMMLDYVYKLYIPLLEAQEALQPALR